MSAMLGATSRDPSSAHAGAAAGARAARGERQKAPRTRLHDTLRALHRLALALVTVVVCAGMTSAGRGSGNLVTAALGLMALDGADVTRGAPAPESSYCPQHDSERLDLEAMESDIAEEDPPCDESARPSIAFQRLLGPRELPRGWRRERDTDAWRFFASARLPRGPPT